MADSTSTRNNMNELKPLAGWFEIQMSAPPMGWDWTGYQTRGLILNKNAFILYMHFKYSINLKYNLKLRQRTRQTRRESRDHPNNKLIRNANFEDTKKTRILSEFFIKFSLPCIASSSSFVSFFFIIFFCFFLCISFFFSYLVMYYVNFEKRAECNYQSSPS